MPLPLSIGDKVQMKKKHPCGGNMFTLQRVGADCRASCDTCGAQIWMKRQEFEKKVKKIQKGPEAEGGGPKESE